MVWPKKFNPTPKATKGWHADRHAMPRRWLKHLSPRRDLPSGRLPIPDYVPETGAELLTLLHPEYLETVLESPLQASNVQSLFPQLHNDPDRPGTRLVDWFVHERGVSFALAASLRARTPYVTNPSGRLERPLTLAGSFNDLGNARITEAKRLRWHLAAADVEIWTSAREVARRVRDEADPTTDYGKIRRAEIAYVFGTHRPWVEEGLADYAASDSNTARTIASLLSSCIWDLSQFELIRQDMGSFVQCVPDLVHQFGASLEPWVREQLSDARVQLHRWQTKEVRAALEILATETAEGDQDLPAYVELDRFDGLAPAGTDTATLIAALRMAKADPAATRVALAGVDADVCADAAWTLFEQWLAADVPKEDLWVLDALQLYGASSTDAKLADNIAALRIPTAQKRAVELLASRSTANAARLLLNVERSDLAKPVREHASKQLDTWCHEHRLDRAQIEDRTAQDFGFGETGVIVYDLGSRRVHVRLSAELAPELSDDAGTPLKSFPRKRKSDDPDAVIAATQRWRDLRAELAANVEHETMRLEAYMGARRSWTIGEAAEVLLPHPILGSLAMRLVWLCTQAGPHDLASFRFGTDGSQFGPDNILMHLDFDTAIRIAHPARLGLGVTRQWAKAFADEQIVQPFAQLARACYETDAAGNLSKLHGRWLDGTALRRLTNRGWAREKKQFNGFVRSFGDISVRIECESASPTAYLVDRVIALDQSDTTCAWETVATEVSSEVQLDLVTVLSR